MAKPIDGLIRFTKNTSLWGVNILTTVILFAMVILNINTLGTMDISLKELLIALGIIAGAVVIGLLVYKVKNRRYFILGLFFTSLIIRLVWIYTIPTVPVSDFSEMYEGARNILNGQSFLVANSEYFHTWPYQLGFTVYQMSLLKIFGDSIMVLKVANVLASACIPVVIFYIAKVFTSEKKARVVALMYGFYVTSITMTSVLTNQHMATLLIYLGLYLLIRWDRKKLVPIYAGLLIGLGNVLRPEGIIVIIAIVLFYFAKDFQNIKNLKVFLTNNIGKSMMVIAAYMLTMNLVSMVFISKGYTQYPLTNRDPYWKFVVGLNQEKNGSWSQEDLDLVIKYPLGEERNAFEKELVLQRLENKGEVLKLFGRKFKAMWASTDWGSLSFALNYENVPKGLGSLLLIIEKIQYLTIIILAFYGILRAIINRLDFGYYHFFSILLIGYVFVHFLVEIQSRYRYFIIPAIFILATFGLSKKPFGDLKE